MRSTALLACFLLAAGSSLAYAASDTPNAGVAAEGKAAGLTAEQKAEASKRARSKWESMTPEQKAQARERAQSKWDSMSPEQKAEAKNRLADSRKNSERVATKEKKEKTARKPAADLAPLTTGPR
jgi:sRNA-binding protein